MQRLVEITEGIRRAREMNIQELIPELEKEREELKQRYIRLA